MKLYNDLEKKAKIGIISKLGLGLPVKQAMTLRIGKKFGQGDPHRVEIFSIYDFKHKDFLFQPKMSFSPEDDVNVEVGLILFDGEKESIFGQFREDLWVILCPRALAPAS